MIAHLQGREKAVEELGFKAEAAEWIALVALHSGVFLRSQYGRIVGTTAGPSASVPSASLPTFCGAALPSIPMCPAWVGFAA